MASVSTASALGSIRSPHVTKGEASVEYKGYRKGDDRKAQNNAQSHVVEIGYSPTDRLKLDAEGQWKRQSGSDIGFDLADIAARYALTEPGTFWIDSAVYSSYAWTEDKDAPQEVSLGLLLQKEYGKFTHRANAYLTREVGDNHHTGVDVETRYLAQYDYKDYLNPGIEWQAEWGNTNDFDGQAHYVGPAAYGTIPVEIGAGELEYQLIYYRGVSDKAADNAIRWTVAYSLKF
ncbi:MAG: hypothetical protein U1E36_05315 [Rickettsiales bacterium]